MTLVVDASVAFKWFVDEPDSDSAVSLRALDSDLTAPDLIVSEICNSVWKSFSRDELTAVQCEIVATNVASAFTRLVAHATLARRAMQMAIELRHPAYDCF